MEKVGYWSLRPWGMKDDFDVHGFVDDVGKGLVSVPEDSVWYSEFKERVESGLYDHTFKNNIRLFFLNLTGSCDECDPFVMVAAWYAGVLGDRGYRISLAMQAEDFLNRKRM